VPPPDALSPVVVAAFNTVMSARAIRSVYQPIFTLDTLEIAGYEALARGPSGTVWHDPSALVSYAERVGRLPELDWICRAAACRGALEAGLPADVPLFVNVEPMSSRTPCPLDLVPTLERGIETLQIVAEVTERAVATDPAGLLLAVEQLREYANRIALDDVGVDPSSQALMPLLRPDVIKLDRAVIQDSRSPRARAVADAVAEHAARTGAIVLAEGIETEHQLADARAMGAVLGQGFLLGRPAPLPRTMPHPAFALPALRIPGFNADTPFEAALQRLTPRRVTQATMDKASRLVEQRGIHAGQPSVLLASFQHVDRFDPRTRMRYTDLAQHEVLAAVYAHQMPNIPGPNLRGCPLAADDPVAAEWNVLHIGAYASSAVLAREVWPRGLAGSEREFDMITTDDPEIVIAAARPLVRRLRSELPLPPR
jgi:EAL domain-containing protein (putative c-di-GMP-specific phosphodiesterase class I)